MAAPRKTDDLIITIRLLFGAGQIERVEQLVTKHWIVFPELPESIRDSDRLAFAAVSSNMQIGHAASERLRKDITFFVRAFNKGHAVHGSPVISITTPRDMFFMLKYARSCCHYGHLITETEVSELFEPHNLEHELVAATALEELINSLKSWPDISYDPILIDGAPRRNLGDARMQYFEVLAPGFSEFSYFYASAWLSRNMTFREVFG